MNSVLHDQDAAEDVLPLWMHKSVLISVNTLFLFSKARRQKIAESVMTGKLLVVDIRQSTT